MVASDARAPRWGVGLVFGLSNSREKYASATLERACYVHYDPQNRRGGVLRMLFYRVDLRMHRKIVVIDGEVAYTDEQIAGAAAAVDGKSEMEAVIAYLQGLGTNMKGRM